MLVTPFVNKNSLVKNVHYAQKTAKSTHDSVFKLSGTAMLPVVAFPFEDFYMDTHNIIHHLEPREQQILFYIGLLAAALGIGGIRAILCPLGAYHLQGYDQHQLLSFFNWWGSLVFDTIIL